MVELCVPSLPEDSRNLWAPGYPLEKFLPCGAAGISPAGIEELIKKVKSREK